MANILAIVSRVPSTPVSRRAALIAPYQPAIIRHERRRRRPPPPPPPRRRPKSK